MFQSYSDRELKRIGKNVGYRKPQSKYRNFSIVNKAQWENSKYELKMEWADAKNWKCERKKPFRSFLVY